ncbi:MAG: hypothetical protein JWQ35_1147 [Bacteriovoracaceae bacterium]|nr:hypothetical protein [Bacteriovoracaceae bacterium]
MKLTSLFILLLATLTITLTPNKPAAAVSEEYLRGLNADALVYGKTTVAVSKDGRTEVLQLDKVSLCSRVVSAVKSGAVGTIKITSLLGGLALQKVYPGYKARIDRERDRADYKEETEWNAYLRSLPQ